MRHAGFFQPLYPTASFRLGKIGAAGGHESRHGIAQPWRGSLFRGGQAAWEGFLAHVVVTRGSLRGESSVNLERCSNDVWNVSSGCFFTTGKVPREHNLSLLRPLLGHKGPWSIKPSEVFTSQVPNVPMAIYCKRLPLWS